MKCWLKNTPQALEHIYIFFYSNFKFHRLYSVKGHEFKALNGLKEMDSHRFGKKIHLEYPNKPFRNNFRGGMGE